MGQETYSSGFAEFSGEIVNPVLRETLLLLQAYAGGNPIKLLHWRDGIIAVPLVLDVDMPPFGNLDIRAKEPVLVAFSLKDYPNIAPIVFTDRLDFPKAIVPHMYLPRKGKPPGFCLVKGGKETDSEWYANKRIPDVLIRVSNWLRDAAAGVLVIDGDHYDPLRLVGYDGFITFDYDTVADVVRSKVPLIPDEQFARLQFEIKQEQSSLSHKLIKIVPAAELADAEKEEKIEAEKDSTDATKNRIYRGFLLWSEADQPIDIYDVDLPKDWGEFRDEFCGLHLLDAQGLEREILRSDGCTYLLHTIIVAIKRPKRVLGFSDSIEFISFRISLEAAHLQDSEINPETSLELLKHVQPLTHKKAREMSGFTADNPIGTLAAGGGALGSKVVLHLAKSGSGPYWVADDDSLLPHNFIRHGLSARYVAINKAKALHMEALRIFPKTEMCIIGMDTKAGEMISPALCKLYNKIYDFTASKPFLYELIKANLPPETQVSKAYISDFGQLGVLLIEGVNRNPRLDDLQAQLFYNAMDNDDIMEWLNREADTSIRAVNFTVGIGCNTETTVLSDDIVSLHAAIISGHLKNVSHRSPSAEGYVYLNQVQQTPFFQNKVNELRFQPVTVIKAVNNHEWEIRFSPGILDTINGQMYKATPFETGGVMIGCANFKTKTVHVTGLLDAPPDSRSNPVCFFRGKEGLAQEVQVVTDRTGGKLGYIGEWHSHPHGPNCMSETDTQTVHRFKAAYDQENSALPVFLLIVTPDLVLPFIH